MYALVSYTFKLGFLARVPAGSSVSALLPCHLLRGAEDDEEEDSFERSEGERTCPKTDGFTLGVIYTAAPRRKRGIPNFRRLGSRIAACEVQMDWLTREYRPRC